MSTHKKIDIVCVAVLLLALCLTVLFMNGSALGIKTIVDEDSEAHSDSAFFTANDRNGSWDTGSATVIHLDGSSSSVKGNGAYVLNNDIIISSAGQYIVSGSLTNGSIVVDANSSAKIWILLNGVSISNDENACIRVDKADKVFLTLADGSSNTLTCGDHLAEDNDIDGVLFSKDDLTINGSGALTISGGDKHGISVNDNLVITGGQISVDSKGDALHVNDSIRICAAELTLKADDDGIALTKDGAYLYVESGELEITAGNDGITSAGETIFAGGEIEIKCSDDALHAKDSISIYDGTLNIPECYEGLEGRIINIYGGEISITPSDDAINAYGGVEMMNALGPESESDKDEDDAEENPCVNISGGNIRIINSTARDADGIDSNGDINISGGSIFISLTNDGSNNAIDYGSENGGICRITGGTIVACGSYQMAEGFDSSSTQPALMYTVSYGLDAGTSLSLEDTDGNTLLQETIPCSFSCAILSCPDMQLGETYLLIAGEEAAEITLNEVSASYGNAQSEMFAGPMNAGKLQNIGNFGDRPNDAPDYMDRESAGASNPQNDMPSGPNTPQGENAEPGGNPPFDIAVPNGPNHGDNSNSEPAEDAAAGAESTTIVTRTPIYTAEDLPGGIAAAVLLVCAIIFAMKFRRRKGNS